MPGQCHTIPHERSPGTPSTAVDSCAPAKSFLDALDYVAVSVSSAMLAWAIWVVPVVAGGQSTSENLALACVSCSLRKGARLVTVDPYTGEEVVLFDPRRDAWRLHFRWDGVRVVGYHTDRTRNGHGATHEPSAGPWQSGRRKRSVEDTRRKHIDKGLC